MNAAGVDTLLQAATAALHTRRWADATRAFDAILALDDRHVQGWLGRGVVALEQKHYATALQAMERALQLSPGEGMVHANLAGALRALGRTGG